MKEVKRGNHYHRIHNNERLVTGNAHRSRGWGSPSAVTLGGGSPLLNALLVREDVFTPLL